MTRKTYGRELALAVLFGYVALIGFVAYRASVQEGIELIRILWLPVTALVGGAFGIKNFKGSAGRDTLTQQYEMDMRER